MAGWNNRNCCCESKTYTCADGAVNICCMTLQASTWARALSAYANNTNPDSTCGYVASPFHHNNVCGSVSSFIVCDSLPSFRIFWGIQSDGTVTLRMELYSTEDSSGNYVPPVFHSITGLDPDTWYLSPVVFTVSGVTYTIEMCPDPHEPFPEWPLSVVYMQMTGAFGPLVRSTGNLLCGVVCTGYGDLFRLQWRYNVYSDKITITASAQLRTGPFSLSNYSGALQVDYDGGAWSLDTHTITLTAIGAADVSVTVSPVDSCDIPPPPPPCEVSNACFPDGCPCIVDGSDGSLYRDLVADVSGPVTHTGLALAVNSNENGWDYNQAFPGTDSLVIRCINGGLDLYYVAAVFGGVNYFFSIPAGGIDCDPDDTNQILDITLTDGTITIRIYTL